MKIAQYKGKSFTSRIIKLATHSEYSHSAFLFDENTERVALRMYDQRLLNGLWRLGAGSVVEAWVGAGVRSVPSLSAQHSPGTRVDIYRFVDPLTDEEEELLLTFLDGEMGCDYDLIGAILCVTRFTRCHPHDWFCSELVDKGADVILHPLFAQTQPEKVPPDWVPRSLTLRYERSVVTV